MGARRPARHAPCSVFGALAAIACFVAAGALMLFVAVPAAGDDGLFARAGGTAAAAVRWPCWWSRPLAGVDEATGSSDQARRHRPWRSPSPGCCCSRSCPTVPASSPSAAAGADRGSASACSFSPNSRLLSRPGPARPRRGGRRLLSTSRLLGQTLAAVTVGILLAGGAGLGPVPLFVACALAVVAALCSLARYKSVTRAGGTMATYARIDFARPSEAGASGHRRSACGPRSLPAQGLTAPNPAPFPRRSRGFRPISRRP